MWKNTTAKYHNKEQQQICMGGEGGVRGVGGRLVLTDFKRYYKDKIIKLCYWHMTRHTNAMTEFLERIQKYIWSFSTS